MRTSSGSVLLLTLLFGVVGLLACSRPEPVTESKPVVKKPLLTMSEAEAIIRALESPPPTTLQASMDEDLEALQRAGLIRFKGGFKKRISVTESGASVGLDVEHRDPEFEKHFGPVGVAGELCASSFDKITAITPRDGGPHPAVAVKYEFRNTPRPLHATLASFQVSDFLRSRIESCSPAKPILKEILLVKRSDGWRPNQLPEVPDDGMSVNTKLDYDEYGRLDGATTVFELRTAAVDPDGDAVEVLGWDYLAELDFDKKELIPSSRMKAEGLKVTFDRIIVDGKPAGGLATYKVRDPWEEATFRFCAEGPWFSCGQQ
jgi:hypothetical protein